MRFLLSLLAGVALLLSGDALAIQFTPGVSDRLNMFQSGDPGSPFNTGPGGVDYDGVGSGDAHPGEVVVTGQIPNLCINGGACAVGPGDGLIDFGSNPIAISLEAQLLSADVNFLSATQAQFVATFGGTADGQPDLVLTDPTDSTILLESDLVAGTLNGNPVAPITVLSSVFDPNSPPAQPNLQAFAFFQTLVNGNPWEILFSDDVGTLNDSGIAQTLISNFVPGFDQIAGPVAAGGDLPSVDAEANGFIFALDGSQFSVPEPGTAWLLGGALLAWAGLRRRGHG